MEIADLLETIEKELPPPAHAIGKTEAYWVAMRDGVKLRTTVIFPDGGGPWPVIFTRNPYFIRDTFPWAPIAAKHGYAVVMQEVRGRGDSEGKMLPFLQERNDGLDSLDWLIRQTWMNGNIGMYGASYVAAAQWLVADRLPPEVKTLFIEVIGAASYNTFYRDGMFKEEVWTYWTAVNSGPYSRANGRELYEKSLRVKPALERDVRLFEEALPWYRDWISNPSPASPYWNDRDWGLLNDIPRRIGVPLFLVGGWFDHFVEEMLASYRKLPQHTKEQSRFVIGPWYHDMKPCGDLTYPNEALLGKHRAKAALEWFDYQLKGAAYPHALGTIDTYTIKIGGGGWKSRENGVHSSESLKLYLKPSDALPYKGGQLLRDDISGFQETVHFFYNPDEPVPAQGGCYGMRPGSVLQDEPGAREDVVTFISKPLQYEWLIEGRMKVRLNVSSSAADTSFSIKIMEVLTDGRAYNISDGIATLAYRNGREAAELYRPGKITAVEIASGSTAWTVNQGSRIRLDISSSNYPAYHAHPNAAGPWASMTNTAIARQTLHWDHDLVSYLDIPVSGRRRL